LSTPFPHRCQLKLAWPRQAGAELYVGVAAAIDGCAATEFGGRDAWCIPEQLLLSSLSLANALRASVTLKVTMFNPVASGAA
jgi:hypothetical protein